jgi:hypothetical protein
LYRGLDTTPHICRAMLSSFKFFSFNWVGIICTFAHILQVVIL